METMHPDIPHVPLGWECPRCHAINAPHVRSCDCPPQAVPATTDEPTPYFVPRPFTPDDWRRWCRGSFTGDQLPQPTRVYCDTPIVFCT